MHEEQPNGEALLTVVLDAELLPVGGALGSNLGTGLQVLHLQQKPRRSNDPHLRPSGSSPRLWVTDPRPLGTADEHPSKPGTGAHTLRPSLSLLRSMPPHKGPSFSGVL